MGCTSSTPSYVDSSTQHIKSTEDKNEVVTENNEELVGTIHPKINNNIVTQINQESTELVLPERDIMKESQNFLHRNDSIDSTDDDVVENNISHRHRIDEKMVIDIILSEKQEAEERRLRDIEFGEELSKIIDMESKSQEKEKITKCLENNLDITDNLKVYKATDNEKNECYSSDTDDVLSESSRTTRWEALADVAAELPPSLTVDPTTGQIYTLSK